MATGLAASIANAILDALTGEGSAFSASAGFYAKLHIGDPGAAGTANAAANTTREACSFSAASGGGITNSADIDWTSVPNAETYSHLSFWTAAAGGSFICSCALTASKTMGVGDDFTVPAGDLDITLPVAA